MTSQTRQWVYSISAVLTALIPLLVSYKVLDNDAAGAWLNVVAALGALGSGGAVTAAITLAKQRKDGVLDFTGSPAQQAISAIQATADQAANAANELDKVRAAVTDVAGRVTQVSSTLGLPGTLVDQLLKSVNHPK